MTPSRIRNCSSFFVFAIILVSLSSCINSKKLDKFVAEEYNNALPGQDKKTRPDIVITSVYPGENKISTTKQKTSNMLPLLFYWQFDYKYNCKLNPSIAV